MDFFKSVEGISSLAALSISSLGLLYLRREKSKKDKRYLEVLDLISRRTAVLQMKIAEKCQSSYKVFIAERAPDLIGQNGFFNQQGLVEVFNLIFNDENGYYNQLFDIEKMTLKEFGIEIQDFIDFVYGSMYYIKDPKVQLKTQIYNRVFENVLNGLNNLIFSPLIHQIDQNELEKLSIDKVEGINKEFNVMRFKAVLDFMRERIQKEGSFSQTDLGLIVENNTETGRDMSDFIMEKLKNIEEIKENFENEKLPHPLFLYSIQTQAVYSVKNEYSLEEKAASYLMNRLEYEVVNGRGGVVTSVEDFDGIVKKIMKEGKTAFGGEFVDFGFDWLDLNE